MSLSCRGCSHVNCVVLAALFAAQCIAASFVLMFCPIGSATHSLRVHCIASASARHLIGHLIGVAVIVLFACVKLIAHASQLRVHRRQVHPGSASSVPLDFGRQLALAKGSGATRNSELWLVALPHGQCIVRLIVSHCRSIWLQSLPCRGPAS
jgi:hypothetical protein